MIDPDPPAALAAAQRAAALSEARLREVQITAQVGNWDWTAAGDEMRPSKTLLGALSLPDDGTLSTDEYLALVHDDDRERARTAWLTAIAERAPFATDYRLCLPGGGGFWLDVRGRPTHDEAGSFIGLTGTAQDITERKQSERESHFQARLLDQVDAGVIAVDLDGVVTHWNAAAERLYGWTAQEAVGERAESLIVPGGGHASALQAADELERNGQWEGEFQLRRKDATTFPAWVTNSLLRDDLGRTTGRVGVSVDMTVRKAEHEQLRLAERFLATVTDNMAEGLFTVDRDGRLTYMNPVAERMLGWREDELRGVSIHNAIHHTKPDGSPHPPHDCPVERARDGGGAVRVEEDVFVRRDGTLVPVTFTASPLSTVHGVTGVVVVFSDISERQAERQALLREMDELTWIGRIQDALREDRFVLFAQPIIALADGRTVSHELLIRMRDGESIVPPDEFLPTAERHGLIKDIDRWVIGEATRIAATGAMVHLNVSAMSFGDPGLPDTFREALRSTGADPGKIVVELTETALIRTDAAEDVAGRLIALGLQLALDDFGTGYGGFTYLKRLAVTQLKIDREFVRDLTAVPASRHVVEAVIALARGFGQKTVAEGVEDEAALDLLAKLGVDYAQGYHIARPRPADEVIPILTAG